jgi:hypothetical protein
MAKNSLYGNIDAKRKRIKAGSGEKMAKAGDKGRPTKEIMNSLKKNKIKKISKALVKASKLHAGQAKVLKKVIKKR